MFKSIKAIGDLTVANSIALENGKCNGEMHKARQEYEAVDKEVYEFMMNEC
jgi:hypothetical protein